MSKAYNSLYPIQARAKWLVQKAVQRGKLIKPTCCQRCRKEFPKNKLQAHHHDYTKPLEVTWYCSSCHKEVHKRLIKEGQKFTERIKRNIGIPECGYE